MFTRACEMLRCESGVLFLGINHYFGTLLWPRAPSNRCLLTNALPQVCVFKARDVWVGRRRKYHAVFYGDIFGNEGA